MDLNLDTPVRFVPRVGPAMAAKLEILGIRVVRDLLYHIPFRYNDFSLVSPIAKLQAGETVTVHGTVDRFDVFATKTGKKVAQAKVRDETGVLTAVWFNQPYLRSVIRPGESIHLSGTAGWFGNTLVLNSPEYELFDGSLHTGRIVPVYPATEGLSSKWMRSRIAFLLEVVSPLLSEYIPTDTLKKYNLTGLPQAVTSIHFPKSLEEAQKAKRRLAFDELLILQLRAIVQKQKRHTEEIAYPMPAQNHDTFVESLPFALTHDQEEAIAEILTDLAAEFPMNRLLVGDVGSGKTVVAAAAIFAAFQHTVQSVLMAPTQILAQQHYETLSRILTPLGLSVGLVTGSHKDTGAYDTLVGTHALLSDSTKFKKLGLVVIDEQHRFGVTQRDALIGKGSNKHTPHILTMTATPIPRTVAKTIMGHMDISTLLEMPKGRKLIKTWVVPEAKRENAYAWITKQILDTGGQAFIICPLIEESETLSAVRAVKKEYEVLTAKFPQFSLGLLHGRMKPKEKTAVLEAFRNNTHQILVATPVVEVGIDIPNATIMVIEAAERFGLSQLHQMRGRVGRSSLPSYCLLFAQGPDERLKILEHESRGPKLAEADLERRGAGDILGTRQHGIPNLKIATFTDATLIEQTQKAALALVSFPHLRAIAQNSTIVATKD